MNEILTRELVLKSLQRNEWDLGNETLYDLCSKHFGHDHPEKIVAKVWLIGRSYSVAVERRKNKSKTDINDNFYTEKIVPNFRDSDLDARLNKLKETNELSEARLKVVLETHEYLTKRLKEITAMEKRSFSSKYLHFHLPSLFFIYDSRAVIALGKLNLKISKGVKQLTEQITSDKVYTNFFAKCMALTQFVKENYDVSLTPRELDKLLLEVANKEILIKKLTPKY